MTEIRTKDSSPFLSCVVALFAIAPQVAFTATRDAELSPDEVVARLVSLPHGLAFLDPESLSLLNKVKGDPATYLPSLDRRLRLPDDRNALASVDTLHALERTLAIVREIGPEHGSPMLHRAFSQTADLRRESECSSSPRRDIAGNINAGRHICRFLGEIIDVFAAFKDDGAVEYCLAMAPNENIANQTISLRYLEIVAPFRRDIRPKLEEMYDLPTSPLRNNPQLKRVLDAMDAADKGKKPEDKDAKSRPEGERKP